MEYKLIFIHQHMLIEHESGNLVIDTGSPQSMHKNGKILIGGTSFHVNKQISNVDSKYLSQKIGEDISGLIGMDILCNYEAWFDYKLGTLLLFDDESFSNWPKGGSLMTLPTLELEVDGHKAKMILDSGAQYSYISKNFIDTQSHPIATVTDFSPLMGLESFDVPLFEKIISVSKLNPQLSDTYRLAFGKMPPKLSIALETLGIDGIVGINFFKTFRIVLSNGKFVLPPQGI